MRKPKKEIQFTSYNELLGIDESANPGTDQIVEIPLSELHPFKDHPFQVRDDEKMEETVESIRNYFEKKETELPNESKEENPVEQSNINEKETLEEKQDDTVEVQEEDSDGSKENKVNVGELPELGPDIGKRSLGEDLGIAEILDENTPSFLANEGSICTIVKGVEIPYMSWSTHMFTVNSETGSYSERDFSNFRSGNRSCYLSG